MSLYFAAPALTMTATPIRTSLLSPFITKSLAPPDPAAAAEAQLQKLLDQQRQAELDAAVAQARVPADDETPWGLYIGVGVGVLALISGVVYLRKRSKR
jgi:hypothetical protein